MKKIETVLFDLDGTLIDSNELIIKSFQYTFSKFGYSFTIEEISQFNGSPLRETFYDINPDLAEEMIRTYREHNQKYHNEYVKLFPNVKETLKHLKKAGIKMGIVSAKVREGVKQGLEVTGIKDYFDTIIAVDNVKNPKPHPEPVLKGLTSLEGSPDKAMMVGDNYHDIEAGKRAGVKTVGVAWSHKGEEYLRKFQPNYVVYDMKELLNIVGV